MFHKTFHLSDQELLLTADGEHSPRRRARARAHLAGCPSCCARMDAIEQTLAETTRSGSRDLSAPLPPASASRAQLAMRLAELSRPAAPSPVFRVGQWAFACGALVAAGIGLPWLAADRTTSSRALDLEAGVLARPHAHLTPGTARPVTVEEMCGPGRYGRTRPIPVSVHQSVFASYGADYGQSASYELDYLITPELGGTSDARNLWPQPYTRTPWNAYVKDELELHLHRLACEGTIDFATAQREIATDWIAAYQRYFKTSRPLRDYATSPLTERDGELLLAELEELGVSTQADPSDGPALMATLRAARQDSSPRLLLASGNE